MMTFFRLLITTDVDILNDIIAQSMSIILCCYDTSVMTILQITHDYLFLETREEKREYTRWPLFILQEEEIIEERKKKARGDAIRLSVCVLLRYLTKKKENNITFA